MSYHIYFIAGDFDTSRPQAVPEASTRPQAITLTRDHPVVPAPVASHMVHRPRPSVPVRPRPSTPISLPVPPRPATLIPPTPTALTSRTPLQGPPIRSQPPTSSPLTSPPAPTITTVTDQAGQQFPTDIIAFGPRSASATTRSRSPLPRRRRRPSPDRHVEHPLSRPPGTTTSSREFGHRTHRFHTVFRIPITNKTRQSYHHSRGRFQSVASTATRSKPSYDF